MSNWRRWLGVEEMGTIAVPKLTHDRIRDVAIMTGMTQKFWANVAIRFFFAHAGSAKLIEAAKGVTLDEYHARTGAMDRLVEKLIEETGEADTLLAQSREDKRNTPKVEPTRPKGFVDPNEPKKVAVGNRLVDAPPKPPKGAKGAKNAEPPAADLH